MSRSCVKKDKLTCRIVGAYRDALTRGQTYDLIEMDAEKRQVRIRGNNGKLRWFPLDYFATGAINLSNLAGFEICDDLTDADHICVEVIVTLSNGERRLCFFATPTVLSSCGDVLEGTNVHFHYATNMIVSTSLNEEVIGRILEEMNDQDMLVAKTVSLDES